MEESYKVYKWQRELKSAKGEIEPFAVEKMQTLAAIYWPAHYADLDPKISELALAADDYLNFWKKHRTEDNSSAISEIQWEIVEKAHAIAKKLDDV